MEKVKFIRYHNVEVKECFSEYKQEIQDFKVQKISKMNIYLKLSNAYCYCLCYEKQRDGKELFMNFYIGKTREEIEIQDENIEFSDELINFLYQIRGNILFDLKKIYEIDPYADELLYYEDLPQIINICKNILESSILQGYADPEEGTQMIYNLVILSQKAMEKKSGLISIGD